MPSELLSHRLVAFRERHGLTQGDLAEMLSVTPRYLIYLEAGQKEADPNGGLAKLFAAYEKGQIPIPRTRGISANGSEAPLKETPAIYKAAPRRSAASEIAVDGFGLSPQDVLSQIRADVAMLEGGTQTEKRRAYHFVREVHLPMLAQMLNLTP